MELTSCQSDGRGEREPTVSMCTAGSGKTDSTYPNDVILAKFRPKGVAIFLCFSLACVFLDLL